MFLFFLFINVGKVPMLYALADLEQFYCHFLLYLSLQRRVGAGGGLFLWEIIVELPCFVLTAMAYVCDLVAMPVI